MSSRATLPVSYTLGAPPSGGSMFPALFRGFQCFEADLLGILEPYEHEAMSHN